jgi:hypothetical protein
VRIGVVDGRVAEVVDNGVVAVAVVVAIVACVEVVKEGAKTQLKVSSPLETSLSEGK